MQNFKLYKIGFSVLYLSIPVDGGKMKSKDMQKLVFTKLKNGDKKIFNNLNLNHQIKNNQTMGSYSKGDRIGQLTYSVWPTKNGT